MNSPTNTNDNNANQPDSPQKRDAAPRYSSNADLRVPDSDDAEDAAMSPTGLDIDNDHADERPVDRSQDAPDDSQRKQDNDKVQAQNAGGDAAGGKAGEQKEDQDTENDEQLSTPSLGPDDEQGVVDNLDQVQDSDKIDVDAVPGEQNDDNASGMLSEGGMEPGDLDEHGNVRRGADGHNVPIE